jgi:hypothetical protein
MTPDEQLMELYRKRQQEYEDAIANEPVREKPNFWRKLGAIGAGAFGGWNFDRGGMQWGQQAGQQILEGPYQQRYNEYLRGLEAKRRGLDLAQEGMTNQARLTELRLRREEADRIKKADLDAKKNKGLDIFGQSVNKQYGQQAVQVEDEEDAQARFGDAIKTGDMQVIRSRTVGSDGRPALYVVPTKQARDKEFQTTSQSYLSSYNTLAKQLGMEPETTVPPDAKVRQDNINAMRALLQQKMQGEREANINSRQMATIGSMMARQNDSQAFRDEQTKAAANRNLWAEVQRSINSIDKEFEGKIAKALENGLKDEAERLTNQRETRKAIILSEAHRKHAMAKGLMSYPQYKVGEGSKMVAEETPVTEIGMEQKGGGGQLTQEEEDRLFQKALAMANNDAEKAKELLRSGKVK